MKKLVLFALATITFAGCKEKEDDPVPDPVSGPDYANLYGIVGLDKDAIVRPVEAFDTSQIFLQSAKSGKIWIGGFEKSSKKQIFDYVFPDPHRQEITVYSGYGEYETILINDHIVRIAFNSENQTIVVLWGMGYDHNIPRCYYSELCFFNKNTLTAEHLLMDTPFNKILPWIENGIILSYPILDSHQDAFMYSLSGDSLFHIGYNYAIVDKNSAINFKEMVFAGKEISEFQFIRLDLSIPSINWTTTLPQWIPSDARIDKATPEAKSLSYSPISKNGNEWTYTWEYTEYSGAKNAITIKIDIDTGTYQLME